MFMTSGDAHYQISFLAVSVLQGENPHADRRGCAGNGGFLAVPLLKALFGEETSPG